MIGDDRLKFRTTWLGVLAAIAACHGATAPSSAPPTAASGSAGTGVPAPAPTAPLPVARGAIATPDTRVPPLIAVIDASGAVRVQAGRSARDEADASAWRAIDAIDRSAGRTVDAALLGRLATEVDATRPDAAGLARLTAPDAVGPAPSADAALAPGDTFATLEGPGDISSGVDDPVASGGRPAGQYRMPRPDVAARVADRALDVDRDRAADDPPIAARRLGPVRLGDTVGLVRDDRAPTGTVLIAADPHAPAAALRAVAGASQALIAVRTDGGVRALRIELGFPRDPAAPVDRAPWLEVRVARDALAIEAVPGEVATVPFAGPADGPAVRDALTRVRDARGLRDRLDVDVLAGADVDVQRLVDALVALDAAGMRIVVLGPALDARQAAARGARAPQVELGHFNKVGDLSREQIAAPLIAALPAVRDCYASLLARQPGLAGTVTAQFFITPRGMVDHAAATGVAPALAICVAGALGAVRFPKPPGGGGVQVMAPFDVWY